MKPIATGKTKELYPTQVVVKSKDIVTWDDKYQEAMPGKAAWSTTTTMHLFRLLRAKGVPVAYQEQVSETEFLAPYCEMVRIEAIGRCLIDPKSSYLKRNPDAPVDVPLEEPIIEFFLKSSKKEFEGIALPADDMFISRYDDSGLWAHHPKQPVEGEGIFVSAEKFGSPIPLTELFRQLTWRMATATLVLRDAFAAEGWTFADWKGEFGFTYWKHLVLADVVDNDSIRVRDPDGNERSKQNIRNGKSVKDAAEDYELVAQVSKWLDPFVPHF